MLRTLDEKVRSKKPNLVYAVNQQYIANLDTALGSSNTAERYASASRCEGARDPERLVLTSNVSLSSEREITVPGNSECSNR